MAVPKIQMQKVFNVGLGQIIPGCTYFDASMLEA